MGAVVLVLALAQVALQACPDLGTDTDAVSLLNERNVLADTHSLADDLVANAEGSLEITPATRDCVNIGSADAAALNLDIDVVTLEGLGCELLLLEVLPRLGGVDAEAREGVWVAHFVCVYDGR